MNRIFALLLNMLCLVISVQLFAQTPVRMHIKEEGAAKDTLIRDFDQMIDARKFLQNWQQQSIRKGHLAASIDTLYLKDSIWQAILFTGPAYKWVKLNLDKLSPPLKQELGLDERQWENKALDPYKLALLQQKILNYCENNGYPFAQTQLEFHSRSKSGIEASLLLHQGAYIQLDSIVVSSNIALNPSFLYQYLEVYPGAAYDERKLKQISKKIKELEFVAEEKPWEMHFSIGKNTLYLFLKEKKSNQLNALIGLQPNTEATQRFMLTAEAELALKNSFGMAESIGLSFQNLQFQSPRLQVNALLPYMLGTRFGADVTFDLYKRDTSFQRVSIDIGLRYLINASDFFRVSYRQQNNRMISFNEAVVIQQKQLPDNVDLSNRGVNVAYQLSHTNYKPNPRKGYEAGLQMGGYFRQVKKNPAISGITDGSGYDYGQLYDSLEQRLVQYRIEAQAALYIPLARQLSLKLGYEGAYLLGDQFFQNELFQIGGFKRLRGFDEQSIFANQFHIATLELRLLLAGDARFFLFADQAYVETQFVSTRKKDYPLGLGVGLHLDTGNGLFSLAIGVGKHSGASFQFRQTKIHFGYVAYF